jgi:hypothetical protein
LWRLGSGGVPSGVELVGVGGEPDDAFDAAVSALRARAAIIPDAPVIVDAIDVHVEGSRSLVNAFARSLVLQAAAVVSPGGYVAVPAGEDWASCLPHRVEVADRWEVRDPRGVPVIRLRVGSADARPGRDICIAFPHAGDAGRALVPWRVDDFRPVLVAAAEARIRAAQH